MTRVIADVPVAAEAPASNGATIVEAPLDAVRPPSSPLEPRDPSPAELGHRIKMLRVARGLTLKDLEQRGGISATHVSEIERGKASPTIGALARIAHALGMRPAVLLGSQALPEVTVHRVDPQAEPALQWGRATVTELSGPTQDSALTLHRLSLPIGREPALTHHHEGEEWLTLLSGVAEVRIDGHSYVLREGDSLHFRAHRPHAYVNLASSPAILLVAGHPRAAV